MKYLSFNLPSGEQNSEKFNLMRLRNSLSNLELSNNGDNDLKSKISY